MFLSHLCSIEEGSLQPAGKDLGHREIGIQVAGTDGLTIRFARFVLPGKPELKDGFPDQGLHGIVQAVLKLVDQQDAVPDVA